MLLLLFSGTRLSTGSPPVTSGTVLTNKPAGPYYSKKQRAELLAQMAHERDLEQIALDAERKDQKLAEARDYRRAFLARYWRN